MPLNETMKGSTWANTGRTGGPGNNRSKWLSSILIPVHWSGMWVCKLQIVTLHASV